MIIAGILQFLFFVAYALLSPLLLLPDVSSNSDITAAVSNANGYIAAIPFHNFILSVIGSLVLLTLFESGYWFYKGIRWLYNKIPGIS